MYAHVSRTRKRVNLGHLVNLVILTSFEHKVLWKFISTQNLKMIATTQLFKTAEIGCKGTSMQVIEGLELVL